MKRLKQLGQDSIIYGIGGILARSVSFILLPIYTRVFSPEQYGSIEMLILISGFVGSIMMMGLDSAQSMYFFKFKKNGKSKQIEIISSILQWRIIWGAVIVVTATILTPSLYALFFQDSLNIEYFAIAFVSAFFAQILAQSIEIFRLLYRPWSFIAVTLAEIILAGLLILTCILVLDLGVVGFFVGSAVSGFIISLLSWFIIREYVDTTKFQYQWWPMLLKFGAPLLPAEAAFFMMSTLDRWFINSYYGAEALGLFAVAAKFSLIVAAVVGAFRKAWWPIAMDSMNSDDGPETFILLSRLYIALGSAGSIALVMLMPWIVKIFTAPVYHATWPVAAILVWQSILYGFFLIGSAGLWKRERTDLNLYLMLCAAVVGVGLNMLLVPPFGVLGASVATVITYLFWNLITMYVSYRLWPIKIPIFVLAGHLSLGLAYTAIYILNGNEIYLTSNTLYSIGVSLIIFQLIFCVPAALRAQIYVKVKEL